MKQKIAGLVTSGMLIAGFITTVGNVQGHNQTSEALSQIQRASPHHGLTVKAGPKPCEIFATTFEYTIRRELQQSFPGALNGKPGNHCRTPIAIPPGSRRDITVIFALVPDPVHTNLALLFDRQIEALQEAAASDKLPWWFDKAILPWHDKEHPQSTDFKIRLQEKQFEKENEKWPGILVFRRVRTASQGKVPTRLLVFVIGENPTAGINKSQFLNAIALAKELYGIPLDSPLSPDQLKSTNQTLLDKLGLLRIFGPTFSGSLDSLQQLLDCSESGFPCSDKKKNTNIVVYSGTVTNCASAEHFKQTASFWSLQEYDEIAIARFLEFAINRGYHANRIAILSEDETQYGGEHTGEPTKDEKPAPSTSGVLDCDKDLSGSSLVRLYFPREISQLRNAFQRSLKQESGGSDKAPLATLPLNLESQGNNDDSVRQYARKQGPLSQEAVLLGITSELRKHHADIVLLRATDPLDQLFLSRYLRSAYPRGRIITLGADMLFAREIEDSRLHGVMALTTYSLTPGVDHKSRGEDNIHSDLVFPSSNSAGSYNAMKLLLNTEQADVIPMVHLFEYEWPNSYEHDTIQKVRRPPVHLTVLAHDGFWDTALLPDPSSDKGWSPPLVQFLFRRIIQFLNCNQAMAKCLEGDFDYSLIVYPQEQVKTGLPLLPSQTPPKPAGDTPGHHVFHAKRLPVAWNIFWLIATGFSVAYLYLLWSASIFSTSVAVSPLAPSYNDSRGWLFAVFGYLHFTLLLALLWAFSYGSDSAIIQGAVLLLLPSLVVVVCAKDLERRRCPLSAKRFLGACIVTLVLLLLARDPDDYGNYLFVQRSVHLTSGISPLLPVLLMIGAGIWGAYYWLSGGALVDEKHRPKLPSFTDYCSAWANIRRYRSIFAGDQERLSRLLNLNYLDRGAGIVVIFVIGGAVWLTDGRPVLSIETRIYEWFLSFLAAIALALLIFSTVRVRRIWSELRNLLQALDALPTRRCFRHLQGLTWTPMWRIGGGNAADLRRMSVWQSRALGEILRLKVNGFELLQETFPDVLENTQAAYRKAINCYLHPDTEPVAAMAPSITLFQKYAPSWLQTWLLNIRKRNDLENDLMDRSNALHSEFATAGMAALAFCDGQWNYEDTLPVQKPSKLYQTLLNKIINNSPGKDLALINTAEMQKAICEQFIALLYTSFIVIALGRIRSLIMAMMGIYIFLLLGVSVYPFQPQVEIRLSLISLLIFIVAVVRRVYAQMHRDAILSQITDTTPGALGRDFWIRMLSFVALPTLSLVASQFPEFASALNSFIAPALHSLK